jgi:hypothetical protein
MRPVVDAAEDADDAALAVPMSATGLGPVGVVAGRG